MADSNGKILTKISQKSINIESDSKPTSNKRKTQTSISQLNLPTCENDEPCCESTTTHKRQKTTDAIDQLLEKDTHIVTTKPPLPPATIAATSTSQSTSRMKKIKDIAYAALVQKLTAHAEQLRLEIVELKSALSNEKLAVRSLR